MMARPLPLKDDPVLLYLADKFMSLKRGNNLLQEYIGFVINRTGRVTTKTVFNRDLLQAALADAQEKNTLAGVQKYFRVIREFFRYANSHGIIFDAALLNMKLTLAPSFLARERERHRRTLKNPVALAYYDRYKGYTKLEKIASLLCSLTSELARELGKEEAEVSLSDFLAVLPAYTARQDLPASSRSILQSFKRFLQREEKRLKKLAHREEYKRDLQRRREAGSHPWVEEYLGLRQKQVVSCPTEKYALYRFIRWLGENGPWPGRKGADLPLSRLTPEIVASYSNSLHLLYKQGKYSLTTVKDLAVYLRMFLKWLEKEKGIPRLADAIEVIYPKKPGNRRLSLETCEKILEAMKKVAPLRDQIAVSLMLLTGCRSCEIARLTLDDIDFERMVIIYHGKRGTARTVPLPPVIVEPLKRYIAERKPLEPDERRVFLNKYGTGFNETNYNLLLNKYLRRARALAGITGVPSGAHAFRHTFITEQERNKVPLEDIMKIVGIKSLDKLQIYLDLEKREVMEEFQEKFTLGGSGFAACNPH